MTRKSSFYILIFISTVLTSCFHFDTNTNDNIIGNYYVLAIDDSEEFLTYSKEKDGSWSSRLIDGSVYEVLWNDNFILTKQHPEESVAELVYNHIRYKLWSDTVNKMNLADNSKLYLDTLLNKTIDDYAKAEFQKRLVSGDLTFINNTKQSDITFYYLIDIKNKPEEPIVFFNKDSLNLWLDKLQVGKLINKRTY